MDRYYDVYLGEELDEAGVHAPGSLSACLTVIERERGGMGFESSLPVMGFGGPLCGFIFCPRTGGGHNYLRAFDTRLTDAERMRLGAEMDKQASRTEVDYE